MTVIWTHCLENAPRRVNHASASVDDQIYSFGGYCTGENYSTRIPIIIHSLNIITMEWHEVQHGFETSEEDVPFNRYGHTVVSNDNLIFLWGGRNDQRSCNVLYVFNAYTQTWSRPKVTGIKPAARDGHSATVSNGKMYIFGGFEDDIDRFSQDVHSLDLKTLTWEFVITRGNPPSWRDFHTLSCIGNKLYVFGGRSDHEGPFHTSREIYDDNLYSLDLSSKTWEKIAIHPDSFHCSPVGRRSHSAFVFKGMLYIFGGFNSIRKEHFNDMHRFDPETKTWSPVTTQGRAPCARRRQSCCLTGTKLYLFGGTRLVLKTFHFECFFKSVIEH
jgi:N-acetylneuraminic acid mutarotase